MRFSAWEMAEAHLEAGEIEEALAALEAHLTTAADDEGRRLRAALLLRLSRDEAGLRRALADLDALSETSADDRVQRSILHEKLGETEAALAQMRLALAARPGDERLAERLIWLLRRAQRQSEALALIRQQPRTWRWLRWEGDLLAEMGDDASATARYGLALAQMEMQFDLSALEHLATEHAQIALARGNAFRRLGLVSAAEEAYGIAEQRLSDPAIGFYRGLLRLLSGDPEMAEELCRAALRQSTTNGRRALLEELREDARYHTLRQRLEQG